MPVLSRVGLKKALALGSLPSQGCELDNRLSQVGPEQRVGYDLLHRLQKYLSPRNLLGSLLTAEPGGFPKDS